MKDHSQSDEEEAEINMTPMLDVVFIMLIFFIVTSVFIKEAGREVEPTKTNTAQLKARASIIIAVTAEDEIWINRQKADEKTLRTIIEKLRAENPRGTLLIDADKEAKARLTVAVMDAARQAGVEQVALVGDQN